MSTINVTGTATVTNGSTTVTIVGGNLVAAGVTAGIIFFENGLGGAIDTVNSNTELDLVLPYAGPTASGLAFTISIDSAVLETATNNANRLATLLDQINPLADYTAFSNSLMAQEDQSAWRTALALGTASTKNTGASGANVPLLNANNTHSGNFTVTGNFGVSGTAAYAHLTDTDGALEGNMSAAVRLYAQGNEHGQLGFLGTASGLMLVRNLQGDLYIEADVRNLHSNSQILMRVDNATVASLSAAGFSAKNLYTGDITIADDAVATVTLDTNSGFVFIHTDPAGIFPQGPFAGCAIFDIGYSIGVDTAFGNSAFATANTDLTGTTGADGKLTIGGVPGSLKIENRSGATRNFRYTILG